MFQLIKRRFQDIKTLTRLCQSAEHIARQEGRQRPGSEHFILASLSLPDRSAAMAFAKLGISEKLFCDALTAQRQEALASIGITSRMAEQIPPAPEQMPPQSLLYETEPSGQSIVKRLADTRKTRSARVLLGADVLLAAAQENYTPACRAFHQLGITGSQLQEAATQAIADVSEHAHA